MIKIDMKIRRVYRHYLEWEDFMNGMWRTVSGVDYLDMLEVAIKFTGDHTQYGKAMFEVIFAWPNTMEHNLTNSSINKLAFIGHCAVCYKFNIPEHVTRSAWRVLSDYQRYMANDMAQRAYMAWRHNYTKNEKQCEIKF